MQTCNKEAGSKKISLLTGTLLAILAICACLLGACSAAPESPDPGSAADSPSTAAETVTVTVDVDSSSVEDKGYPGSMASEDITLEKGATAYDAITATGLSLSGSETYITSVNGLAEGQYGATSGWLYFVDGEMPDVGPGDYILKGGEKLSWVYVLDVNEYF